MGLGLLVSFMSVLWVLTEARLTRRDGMFTAYQMLRKYPLEPVGIPFVWHGGMWGDLVIISPLIGLMVGLYGGQWSGEQMMLMSIIGMALSAVMHYIYIKTPFPDSLAWGGMVSLAGWMHFLYMAVALAVIGLFYFYTRNPMPEFLVITSTALAVHVAIGNHLLLGWLNESRHFSWCPNLIHKPDPWFTTGVACIILVFLTAWAGGTWGAGVAIFTLYAGIAALITLVIKM